MLLICTNGELHHRIDACCQPQRIHHTVDFCPLIKPPDDRILLLHSADNIDVIWLREVEVAMKTLVK